MIEIKEVFSEKDLLKLVKFPFGLYKKSPYWTPPIIKQELNTLDKEKNPFQKNTTTHYYLAYKDKKIVGTVIAIINWIEVNKKNVKRLRFTQFDVIDDIEVTKKIIETLEGVAAKYQMDSIEGPLGFSNLDRFGMLTKGFDKIAKFGTNYNYSYYPQHFKELGWKENIKWIEYEVKLPTKKDKTYQRHSLLCTRIKERSELKTLSIKTKKDVLKYADGILELFNKSFKEIKKFIPFNEEQIEYIKKTRLSLIDPNLLKVIVDKNDNIIAFSICTLAFEKALQKARGKITLFSMLHFLRLKYFNKRANAGIIGIDPEYHKKGVPAIIMHETNIELNKRGITYLELDPIQESNTANISLWDNMSTHLKTRVTFIKELSDK